MRKLTDGNWSKQEDDGENNEDEESDEESEEMEIEVKLRRPGRNYKSQVKLLFYHY